MTRRVQALGALIVLFTLAIAVTGGLATSVAAQSVTDQTASNETTLNLSLSPADDSVHQSGAVEVSVSVENTGTNPSAAPVLDLGSLPEGWTVVSWSGEDSVVRPSTNEWLWTSLDVGETKQLTFTLSTTQNADDLSIVGEVVDVYDNRGTDSVQIDTTASQLTEYTNADGVIDSAELGDAFTDWQNGQISSALLSDVFEAWQTGDPV